MDEFAAEFGVEISEGDFETLSGMVITKLGRIPALNEVVEFKGFSLKVIEKEGHRLKTLIAEKIKPKKSDG